jgi:hypothetical protein
VRFRVIPPIRIHVWGGLGSQLHGVALMFELLKRFPIRRVKIVLHTSGVTIRESELNNLLPTKSLIQLRDYSRQTNIEPSQDDYQSRGLGLGSFFIKVVKHVLEWSGLVARANSDKDFNNLKPWVVSIRGHYTDRSIANWAISEIMSQATTKGLIKSYGKSTLDSGIHYRLGDLMALQSKSPTDSFKVASAVLTAREKFNAGKVTIFSDSGDCAKVILDDLCPAIDFDICEGDTWDVINSLVSARVFIGTSSKVSEWIAIFRLALDTDSQMVLPVHFQKLLQKQDLIAGDAPNVILY